MDAADLKENYGTAGSPNKVDILHPCAELEWRKCRRLPVGMRDAKAVWLGDKLYVGGGWTTGSNRDMARLYIHTPTTDTWSHINSPVYYFALITYHSQLVLVGGKEFAGEHEWRDVPVTNKLWTLTEHGQWRETLPPMATERYRASAVEFADNILVAGGEDNWRNIDIVEVYNGHQWAEAQCLPNSCYEMKSTLLKGHWYLMGGEGQELKVYYASLDSLVASCRPSEKPLPSVWKMLPDVPHVRSSTVVFGNRLIAVGGGYLSSSSIHAYSPHTQSWVHVGDMPIGLHSTCTAVLPTVDLVVIGGMSDTEESRVHKASLKFNVVFTDGHFTMETLSRLEQIGIRPLQEIEAYKGQLQSMVGMDKADLPIDNSSLLLEMWVQGHASLRPTWRHFFWALREIKLNHLADQIEASLSGVAVEQAAISEETEGREEDNKQEQETVITAEEEKHIAAVQKAMEERGMLDHTIVHGVFVGPARSGKNSLMERLLGQMPSSVSPSTGVAESVVQVKVIQKSTTLAANVHDIVNEDENRNELVWSVMDSNDEVVKLVLMSKQPVIEMEQLSINDPSQDVSIQDNSSMHGGTENCEKMSSLPLDTDSNNITKIEPELESNITEIQPKLESNPIVHVHVAVKPQVSSRPRLPDSYIPPLEIFKVALRSKGKDGLEMLQQHFRKTWSLYLTNTGGQMEFQEVLPLLVSGPSVFFFTFRLDRDINKHFMIEYDLSDGTKAEPYKSTLTTVEGLLQTLATIAAMGTFVYKGLQKGEAPLRPKVFIVGTHKDKLDRKTAETQISSIDQQLQEAIKSTTHYENLVEFASPEQLIFTVSNFSNNESGFNDIRSSVQRVVGRDEFQMTSPACWLIFSLALRQLKPYVVSYDECLEIARQCGLADDEVYEALHFIHSKMGLIRYFPYEGVKDLVVIHPQYLFDKVTELIVDTFTFEKSSKQMMEEFKKKGIFSLSEFNKISSRTDTKIKPFQFAKLLERLRIAAPFQMKGDRMYFFPCVLAHTERETPRHQLSLRCTPVPSFIIIFECGYCPKGLPGALITYLMANEMKSNLLWTLDDESIFRNQVAFKVGPLDTVVFKIQSTYLEIVFVPMDFQGRHSKCPRQRICSSIYHVVDAGIKQVTADINYVNAQHSFTFLCGCKNDHPGKLELLDGEPFCLSCDKTGKKYPLPFGHELWQNNLTDIESEDTTPLEYSQSESSIDGGQAVGDVPSVMPMVSQQSQPAHYPYQSAGLGTPTGQPYNPQTHFTTRGMPTGYAPVVPIHPQQRIMAQPYTTVTAPAQLFAGFPQGGIVVPGFNYPSSLPSIYGASARYPAFSQDTSSVTGATSMPQGVSYPAQVQHPTLFGTHSEHFSHHQQSLSEPGRLTQYHLGDLVGQLSQYATRWRDIGTHLGFLPGELSNIEASPNLMQGAPVSWLSAMLAQWLQRTSSATLEDLKTALGKAGLAAAAHDLKL